MKTDLPVVHACLWSQQPDILIACDHSWTTPAWEKRTPTEQKLYDEGIYKSYDGRFYTFAAFDKSKTTCSACLATLADPEKRKKAGTP